MVGQIMIDNLSVQLVPTMIMCNKEYLLKLMSIVEHRHKIVPLSIFYSIPHPVEAYMVELVETEIGDKVIIP